MAPRLVRMRERISMTRFILAGLFALPILAFATPAANAQCPGGCPFPLLGGKSICMAYGSRLHQHGPMYNYTPGYGGAGCTSPWGNHGDRMTRGGFGGGCNHCGGGHHLLGGLFHRDGCNSCGHSGWGHYAVSTFRNVFHRVHPCASRCGHECGVGCGSSGGCSSCGGASAAVAAPAQAALAVMPAPIK